MCTVIRDEKEPVHRSMEIGGLENYKVCGFMYDVWQIWRAERCASKTKADFTICADVFERTQPSKRFPKVNMYGGKVLRKFESKVMMKLAHGEADGAWKAINFRWHQ